MEATPIINVMVTVRWMLLQKRTSIGIEGMSKAQPTFLRFLQRIAPVR